MTKPVSNHKLTIAILIIFYGVVGALSAKSFYVIFPLFLYMVVRNGISPAVRRSMLFFIVPSVLAFAIGLGRYELYDVLKDLTYFLTPVIGLAFGDIFAEKYGANTVLKSFEDAGKAVCIIFLATIFLKFGSDVIYEAREIRDEEDGLGIDTGFFPVITAGIILYRLLFLRSQTEQRIFDFVWLAICILATVASGSRTYLISFAIVAICIAMPSLNRHFVRFAVIASFIALAAAGLIASNDAFIEKFKESIAEISIENSEDLNENENYRGYEAKMTLLFVAESAPEHQIAGNGAGVAVDMGNYAPIRRLVPITHNGYAYILLKFGVLGMLAILFFGIYILQYVLRWQSVRKQSDERLKWLSVGCLATLFAANYVICCIFNVLSYPLMAIVGCTLSFIYKDKRQCGKYRS